FDGELEPGRNEYFLGDTAQAVFAAGMRHGAGTEHADAGAAGAGLRGQRAVRALRIVEPVDGTIMALDPDIPAGRQRMRVGAMGAAARQEAGVEWFLDGAALIGGEWHPRPGRHVFELRGPDGRVLDQARVEVRGGRFLRNAAPGDAQTVAQ